MKMFWKWLGISIVVAAITAAAILGYWNAKRPQSHTIQAQTVMVKNSTTLVVSGMYLSDGQQAPLGTALYTITVNITPQTKFVKTVRTIPSSPALNASGSWDLSKLKTQQETGSMADFKSSQSMPMTIKTAGNAYQAKSVTATELDYQAFVFPN